MRQGLAAWRATGAELDCPHISGPAGRGVWEEGQAEEGLCVLAEALALVDRTEERWWEAELYRLQGELLLAQAVRMQHAEAETCFHQALDMARRQQAKSLGAAGRHEPQPPLAAAG